MYDNNLITAKTDKGKTIVMENKNTNSTYITLHLYQLPKTQLINIKEP